MDTFERDARVPASDDARRSGEMAAGPETPAVILDWHYAASPFATELLASRRAEHGESEADEFPEWLCSPRPAQVAANDNKRVRLVR